LKFFFGFEETVKQIEISSTFIYAASQGIADTLFPEISTNRIAVLPRHIAIPNLVRPNRDKTSSKIRLGMFSAIAPGKGQEDAVLATAKLREQKIDVELFLAGYQPVDEYRIHLETLIRKAGITPFVTISEFIRDPHSEMNECDIILGCSRCEGFGRALVEAMLLEKPIIYAAAGGFQEYMVDGQNGLAYMPGDVEALAGKIAELIEHPERRRALAKKAREDAFGRFTREAYGGAVFGRLTAICTANSNGAPVPGLLVPLVSHNLQAIPKLKRDLALVEATALAANQERDAICASTSWRATRWLRSLGDKMPFSLRAHIRRLLKV
jgi:glycosyltransferase involved in cell wall biosynthesis